MEKGSFGRGLLNRIRYNKEIFTEKAKNNKELVEKWILKKPKNPYYTNINKDENKDIINEGDNEYYALIEWIIPDKKYQYTEIIPSLEIFCKDYKFVNGRIVKNQKKLTRSSFIPVVNINGKQYWMLGSFHDYSNTKTPILMDFGGSCNEFEDMKGCPPLACAFRELEEESKGLLPQIIDNIKNLQKVVFIQGETKDEIIYFIFVFLEYNDVKHIPRIFLDIKNPKYEKLGPIDFYDKDKLFNREYRTSKNLTDLITFYKNIYHR